VAEGFEPSEAFTSHAFEACSLGRSDTPPPERLPRRRRGAKQKWSERSSPCAFDWCLEGSNAHNHPRRSISVALTQRKHRVGRPFQPRATSAVAISAATTHGR
jgi:hypothetical protein